MIFVIGDYLAGMTVGATTALAVRMVVWPGMDMVIAMLAPCIPRQHGGRVTHVESTPHALLIKVRMDDGASCMFGAVTQKHNEMTGGCICDEVWGKPEKGWWRIQRAY